MLNEMFHQLWLGIDHSSLVQLKSENNKLDKRVYVLLFTLIYSN